MPLSYVLWILGKEGRTAQFQEKRQKLSSDLRASGPMPFSCGNKVFIAWNNRVKFTIFGMLQIKPNKRWE